MSNSRDGSGGAVGVSGDRRGTPTSLICGFCGSNRCVSMVASSVEGSSSRKMLSFG